MYIAIFAWSSSYDQKVNKSSFLFLRMLDFHMHLNALLVHFFPTYSALSQVCDFVVVEIRNGGIGIFAVGTLVGFFWSVLQIVHLCIVVHQMLLSGKLLRANSAGPLSPCLLGGISFCVLVGDVVL